LAGISRDAETAATKLIEDAQRAASDRLESAKRQASRIFDEAEEKSAQQVAAIERDSATRLAAAKRRLNLEMKERTYRFIIDRCVDKLDGRIGNEDYRNIIEEWIVQAAAGLRVDSAVVNCSSAEREIVESILRDAERKTEAVVGRPVSLTLSEEPPLRRQGVVVTAADGKTAFNNQVSSRVFRLDSNIRKLVHDRLFQDV
jgi:vacuolar-type H+-ATPase subunit E/Vma4